MDNTASPVQISFRHLAPSAAMEQRIQQLAARLARFSPNITQCRVVVDAPPQHHEQGGRYNVRIEIALAAGGEISVERTHPGDPAHEDPYVALRDAFRAARRQLQDYERLHRHSVHQP